MVQCTRDHHISKFSKPSKKYAFSTHFGPLMPIAIILAIAVYIRWFIREVYTLPPAHQAERHQSFGNPRKKVHSVTLVIPSQGNYVFYSNSLRHMADHQGCYSIHVSLNVTPSGMTPRHFLGMVNDNTFRTRISCTLLCVPSSDLEQFPKDRMAK